MRMVTDPTPAPPLECSPPGSPQPRQAPVRKSTPRHAARYACITAIAGQRRKGTTIMGKVFLGFIVAIVLGFAAFTWLTLHWAYSEGERAGFLQKFSRKGWICKTWEGEMAMVTLPGTVA